MDWLNDLNDAQRRAATARDGPLLIIAGPGTGKTKTLTSRIGYLLGSGRARPDEILALTFTNKAAQEMQHRVAGLPGLQKQPDILTFHGLCRRLLSQHGTTLSFIDEHERLLLIKQLRLAGELKTVTSRELALLLSKLKNLPPDRPVKEDSLHKLLAAYNQELERRGLYDYDDLLQKAYSQLKQNQPSLPYTHILVDEFQDTNPLQYELLQLLRTNDSLCVIGDPHQSIYGFRGASSGMFDRFKADFPAHQKVELTINYRSAAAVVTLANQLYPASVQLVAHVKNQGRAASVHVLNEYSEAAWVISRIEQAIGGSDFTRSHQWGYGDSGESRTFRDFAILYRTHRVGRTIRRALAEHGIPFQIIGDGSPYEQPDMWLLMQLLCYAIQPSRERQAKLESLLTDLSVAQKRVVLKNLGKKTILNISDLAADMARQFDIASSVLNSLLSTLVRFDKRALADFVAYVDALEGNDFYEPAADAVTLLTIHSAKGLEFTHVFLIATEEEILPHKNADTNEEKRLFYVAATRARENLDILHATTRSGQPALISQFVADLPAGILPRLQDEMLASDQRRLQKRSAKRRQGTLFDL